jgi:hypothetical protein
MVFNKAIFDKVTIPQCYLNFCFQHFIISINFVFQYYVTLENGDNLVAKEVDQPKASISGKFTAHNLILVTFISTLLVT